MVVTRESNCYSPLGHLSIFCLENHAELDELLNSLTIMYYKSQF